MPSLFCNSGKRWQAGKQAQNGEGRFASPRGFAKMVNTVGRILSETDRAYLAGLFDADGAIMACIESHSEKKYGFRVRLFIKIAQKNKSFLEKIQRELSWGSVRLNRRVYEYDIRDQKDIISFIDLIYPYSRLKKSQLKIAYKIANSKIGSKRQLIKIARLADSLAKLNVRSPGRRKNFAQKILESVPRND